MAIKPPSWAKDAVPTLKGWKHPKRNEILLPKKFTQDQIDEYLGKSNPTPPPVVPEPVLEEPETIEVDEPEEEVTKNPAWTFLTTKR